MQCQNKTEMENKFTVKELPHIFKYFILIERQENLLFSIYHLQRFNYVSHKCSQFLSKCAVKLPM